MGRWNGMKLFWNRERENKTNMLWLQMRKQNNNLKKKFKKRDANE